MANEAAPDAEAPALSRPPARGPLLGLRLQLMLALGALAVLAFVPLFLAVASLTTHTLRQNREEVARSLGRAVAGRLAADAAAGRDDAMLRDVASVSLDSTPGGAPGGEGVVAIRIVRAIPTSVIEVGHPGTLAALRAEPRDAVNGEHITRSVVDGFGPILEIEVLSGAGASATAVQVALRIGDQASRAAPLLRLVGFYTAAFAFVLIIFAYLLLTRLIVRPVGRLVEATRNIAAGTTRRIDPRAAGASSSEVAELGAAIARTTAQLVDREETLAAKVRQLESARAELLSARDAIVRSERLASVGRLAAGLAHEVGNPIAALLGLEEVLLTGELDDESRDLVTRMKRETERVHRVLRDLLDFARADQEPTSLGAAATTGVRDVVEEVVALVGPQKTMRDIELEVSIEDDLPPVRIAEGRLQQVLLNLVLNAADAIGEKVERASDRTGGPSIGTIEIRAEHAPPYVRVEVRDDGPGVPPQVRAALFEPFVTTKEVGKGTGLGLAVCRGLVEGAGGTIRLADDAGQPGACFVLELPTPDAPPPKRSVAPPKLE